MNLEKTEKSAAPQVAKPDSAVSQKGRRRLVQAGLAGAPLLMALKSTPVLAANCKLPSGFSASGNLSQTGKSVCADPFPSVADIRSASYLAPDPRDQLFATVFGTDPLGTVDPSTYTLRSALNEGSTLNAKAAALYLGTANSVTPNQDLIKTLWVQGVVGNSYTTGGYKTTTSTWTRLEVEKYFNYLLGIPTL